METLSDIIIHSKYSRFNKDLGRKETWIEIINRTKLMHIKRFPLYINEIYEAFEYVNKKKIVPSMRSLQFSGRPIEGIPNIEQGQEQRIYNCGFIPIDTIESIAEVMYCLLMGIGLGVSVRKRDITKLPIIKIDKLAKPVIYTIEDTCEGWADAIKFIFNQYTTNQGFILFDYTKIRSKGAPLIKIQSIAPGPLKLMECMETINKILKKNNNKQLKSINIHKIICKIADCVVSASIRRSALLSIFDKDDKDMISCKTGKWWDIDPHLAMANNSVSLKRDETTEEEFKEIIQLVLNQGAEPGILWTNDDSYGVNACSEISLRPYTFCNLTSVKLSDCVDNEDLFNRCKAATIIGTLQATFTNFTYLRPIWKENTEKDYLIGISLNGCAIKNLHDFNLKKAVEIIKETNIEWANKLKIKPSVRLTTIKPEGTNSLVSCCSSGCHPYHSKYYLRRIRINKTETLFNYLNKIVPELLEKEKYSVSEDLYVFTLAIKIPDNALTRDDESVIEFLERVKYLNQNWISPGHVDGPNKNNVSATVSIKKEDHLNIAEWMWDNKDYYNGLSILEFDGSTYEQTPLEVCSKEKYDEINELVKKIKINDIIDTNIFMEVETGCDGDKCEIKKL